MFNLLSKKCCEDKHVDLFLIGGERKYHVLSKDSNTFMYDHALHCGRHFCCYCLQAFRTAETLTFHIKDCFEINGKESIKMFAKGEYVRFKNYERKIKSLFMISADVKVF